MAKNLELFHFHPSFYAQKVRMYLEEKGATYSINYVNLYKAEHLTDEFLAINPAGKVPVLKADGIIIPDSEEIFKFGEENIAGDNLAPAELAPKIWGLHDQIHGINVILLTFGVPLFPSVTGEVHPFMKKLAENGISASLKMLETKMTSAKKESVPILSGKIDKCQELKKSITESAVSSELERVDKLLQKCADQLGKSSGSFLFGATVTIADIDLAVMLLRLRHLGLEERLWKEKESRKAIVAFMKAMERRDSFRTIAKDATNVGCDWLQMAPLFIVGGISVAVAGVALGLLVANRKIFQ